MKIFGIDRAAVTVLVALPLLFCACHNRGESGSPGETSRPESPAEGTATVCGSVIDLKSGAPAAGVSVVGPGGKTARTDDQGRFELRGGTHTELLEAREWASMFLPEVTMQSR